MGAINLPYNIQNGDGLDADKVMANLQAIITQTNGLLEADNNVQVLAPPNSNVGNSNSEGTSAFLSRADHQHVIQGVENVTTLPTTGNFLGRIVYVTSGVNIGKLLICTDAGANTFLPFAGVVAPTEVPVHAAQHAAAGHDPFPDGTIAATAQAAQTIVSATLGSDVNNISGTVFTDIITGIVVPGSATAIQSLRFDMVLRFTNSTGTARNSAFRLVDVTAGNVTVWMSEIIQINASAQQTAINGVAYITPPLVGSRTYKIQAGASAASAINVLAPTGFNTETVKGPSVQVALA